MSFHQDTEVTHEPTGEPFGGLVRVRLDVAYDGAEFAGWAPQPEQRTVAGVLREGLARLCGELGVLTVAGRTDAGVHATGQVCHVDLSQAAWRRLAEASKRPERPASVVPVRSAPVLRRLAGVLPPDVRVTAATEVAMEFDARFSALRRRYQYRVCDEPWGAPPLRRRDTLSWPWPLDVSALETASRGLLGEHNFAAYCRRKENATTIRTLLRLDWWRESGGAVVAAVEADAFCQAMVRSVVGGLLPVGDGRRPVTWPVSLLSRRDRAGEVTVAPAHGLTLVGVDYPEDPAACAAQARRARARRG